MDIQLYNTLTHSKDVFVPLKKGVVSMYHCGPTVYDTPHLGNYRTFVMNDLIRRVFEYNGYSVEQAMNITDVDDKTIRRAREEKVLLNVITEKYEKLFLDGLDALHIKRPQHLIRATDYISAMIELISTLLDKGYAYKAVDGVYMSIDKIHTYGELVGLTKQKNDGEHARIKNDEYDKENPRDFAVWKFAVPEDGAAKWSAPFGEGRPGWHIECSAMSMKVLGTTIDIHTGGNDLMFPHHTNEIAQSECATGTQFVRYWIHGAFMNVSNEKMAKSKGNFLKLEDLAASTISPLAYRYWLLTAHYRSPVNFTREAVQGAQNALIRLMTTVSNLPEGGTVSASYIERFKGFINDDVDTAQAIALVWDILKDTGLSGADKRATILDMDKVFGFGLDTLKPVEDEEIPPEIMALAEAREEARKDKDWVKADALRNEIEERGFVVSDTKDGIKVQSK
jgi:cysteinyl-tRNA synthetase